MSPLGEHYVYSCHRVKVQKNGIWVKHDNPFSFECRSCATGNWDVVAIFHSMLDVEWLNMIPRGIEEDSSRNREEE